MLQDNVKLWLRLYSKPLAAMSGIIDEGSLLFSLLAALLVSGLLGMGIGATLGAEMYRSGFSLGRSPAARRQPPATPATEAAPAAGSAGEGVEDPPAPRMLARLPLAGLVVAVFSSSLLTMVFSLMLLYTP